MQEKDRKPKKKAAHSPLKLTSAQKLQRKVVFEYEMDSSDSERPVMKHPEAVAKKKDVKKTTETKNIIKNYAKSILNFIKRNVQARRRLLRQFKIEETEFMKVHEQYKGNIHSIS